MNAEPNKITVDLHDDGLLWLVNRVVFHPRGFALGHNKLTNRFELMGNGNEPWHYEQVDEDQLFRAVESAFDRVRPS